MKLYNLSKIATGLILSGTLLASCNDFLDQPAKDSYNGETFYTTDEAAYQGVNPLYNMPWSDFSRSFFKVGEVMSGNYYMKGGDDTQYWNCNLSSNNPDLKSMSYSLWSVNGYANIIYNNIKNSTGPSQQVKNTCMGECLTWKAMAYFYLVRTFGAVPIIHDNNQMIGDGNYNDQYKARIEDVYAYIIKTLEKAIELLPEKDGTGKGRIDKYSAEALLAKVYLTKSGFDPNTTTYESGSNPYIKTTAHQRNAEDLAMAAKYAKDVIDNSGRQLEPVYSDIFRGAYHGDESLLAWHWHASRQPWTQQNFMQSDLAITGFDETGNTWGGYAGPSVDLQDAFGEDAMKKERNNTDVRRQATMMMAGDKYDYFYTDEGGFDFLKFIYKGYPNHQGPGQFQSGTGANCVKQLIGDNADHNKYVGGSFDVMAYGNYTQLLRLADVYLIYTEAMIGNNESTTDASAIDAFYKVRHRAIRTYERPTSVSWEDVWKERRLELACEGDRWYDFVRLFYYNPDRAINELHKQRRDVYWGLDNVYKNWYNNGGYDGAWDTTGAQYNNKPEFANPQTSSFTIPFPTEDATQNPHLLEAPVHVDITQYNY